MNKRIVGSSIQWFSVTMSNYEETLLVFKRNKDFCVNSFKEILKVGMCVHWKALP